MPPSRFPCQNCLRVFCCLVSFLLYRVRRFSSRPGDSACPQHDVLSWRESAGVTVLLRLEGGAKVSSCATSLFGDDCRDTALALEGNERPETKLDQEIWIDNEVTFRSPIKQMSERCASP